MTVCCCRCTTSACTILVIGDLSHGLTCLLFDRRQQGLMDMLAHGFTLQGARAVFGPSFMQPGKMSEVCICRHTFCIATVQDVHALQSFHTLQQAAFQPERRILSRWYVSPLWYTGFVNHACCGVAPQGRLPIAVEHADVLHHASAATAMRLTQQLCYTLRHST